MTLMLLAVAANWGMAAAGGQWDVADYGAVGDGHADNTHAFQAALDAAAAAGGGTVRVAAGHYRFKGVLSIPGAVTLQGTFTAPPTDQRESRPKLDGTVLMAYAGRGAPDSEPFVRLAGSMAVLAGCFVTYPEWRQTDTPPVAYPPTVFAQGNANVAVLDCCFLNPYEAIRFQDSGRFLVRNVYGYPSFRGLYVDSCYDIGRVENCHFWPFGVMYAREDAYCQWVNAHGVAFEFARTDWQYVVNTFCFGYGVGYKFSTSPTGSCNGNFLGIGADCCQRSVVVDTVPGALDLLITNGEFVGRWFSADSVGVEVTGRSTGRVSLTNCAFWGPLDRCIWVHAPEANLTATACGFVDWDIGAQDSPAVQIDGGKAILQGNSFRREGLHVRVNPGTQSAILIGNQGVVGLRVENGAGARTQFTANEVDPLVWPPNATDHYRVLAGEKGDGRYLRGFHSRELARPWNKEGVMRWSGPAARLELPVRPFTWYTLTLDVYVPAQTIDPANGLYLGDTRLAALPGKEGLAIVKAEIPAQSSEHVTLTLRSKVWRPVSATPGPDDARELGIAVRSLTLRARDASDRAFDGNTGAWLE